MALDLDKLKELLAKATPVPWEAQGTQREGEDRGVGIIGLRLDDHGVPMFTPTNGIVAAALPCPIEIDADDYERVEANAALIVAAVNSLAGLIAEAERVDALTQALDPFISGSVASVTDDESIPDHASGSIRVTMGELRAARKAYFPDPVA